MTKRDLERIAYVTEHYGDMLAGLVIASQCPILLFLLIAKGSPTWVYFAVLPTSALVFWIVLRWATRRIGRVVAAQDFSGARRWIPFFGGIAGVRLWGIDNDWLGAGRPSFSLILIGAVCLWLSIRDWPFRRYLLAISALAFAGAAAHMGVVTEADLVHWRVVWCGALVLVVMASGILDYLTLVRVFGHARRSEQVDNADPV
jgi:hypothetical protein